MVNSIQGFGSMQGMSGLMKTQSLTDAQKETVNEILSQYDPENITEEDAKAIFEAFREAGIKGPGLREAIEAAGFDAEDIRTKAGVEGPPPPPKDDMMKSQQSSGINLAALQNLQSILSQYDLSNLSDEEAQELSVQLNNSGLMDSGAFLNISA